MTGAAFCDALLHDLSRASAGMVGVARRARDRPTRSRRIACRGASSRRRCSSCCRRSRAGARAPRCATSAPTGRSSSSARPDRSATPQTAARYGVLLWRDTVSLARRSCSPLTGLVAGVRSDRAGRAAAGLSGSVLRCSSRAPFPATRYLVPLVPFLAVLRRRRRLVDCATAAGSWRSRWYALACVTAASRQPSRRTCSSGRPTHGRWRGGVHRSAPCPTGAPS